MLLHRFCHQYLYNMLICIIPATGAALYAGIAMSQEQPPAISPAPAFTAQDLVKPPTTGWWTNGGNLYNQRYSPLNRINRSNVAQLKGVWQTHLNGSGAGPQYSGEAQPLVHNGVIYIVTGADGVFAISVKSGQILWQYDAQLDPNIDVICCGWTSRGVGLGDGKVFVGQLDGKLVALDQQTGKPVWAIQAERWQEGFSLTSAPLYYNNMVITGFAGAEFGIRGRVKAYAATDGKLLWTFYTIPGPGQRGHESWPQDNEVWKHGGGSVWQTPAVDPELGLLYFSTGNPGPDFNGAVRAGDNLFTDSILALEAATGQYRWHYQQVHHDIWDYDGSNPVVLFDVNINGQTRKAIAEVNKTGWVYILDRISGEPLLGIEEHPVPQEPRQATAATQPYPLGEAVIPQFIDIAPEGHRLVNEGRVFTPFFGPEGVPVQPGMSGGGNWPPNSYDPVRQVLFVCATEGGSTYRGGDRDHEIPPEGDLYGGGDFGLRPFPNRGVFAAMDMTTNRTVWRYRWQDMCYSGSVATAGDLVFVGRNDGRLMALDADTGMALWEFQTGAGMNAPASVFEQDGVQYVVAYAAGNLFAGSASGDSLWLFSLQGTLDPAPEPGAMVAADSVAAARYNRNEADLSRGRMLYARVCLPCHGTAGMGGHGGGAPLDRLQDYDAALRTISNGKNDMPAFSASLTPDQIRDVSAYIFDVLFP